MPIAERVASVPVCALIKRVPILKLYSPLVPTRAMNAPSEIRHHFGFRRGSQQVKCLRGLHCVSRFYWPHRLTWTGFTLGQE